MKQGKMLGERVVQVIRVMKDEIRDGCDSDRWPMKKPEGRQDDERGKIKGEETEMEESR